jgi:hypothetical protein
MGCFCFLLGLLTGFAEPRFKNLPWGLAPHLEGVMNGTFIIALGAVSGELRFSARQSVAAFWTALYGTYANWAATTLAAVFGTAAVSPITSAGQHGPAVAGECDHGGVHDRRGRNCRQRGPRAQGREAHLKGRNER